MQETHLAFVEEPDVNGFAVAICGDVQRFSGVERQIQEGGKVMGARATRHNRHAATLRRCASYERPSNCQYTKQASLSNDNLITLPAHS